MCHMFVTVQVLAVCWQCVVTPYSPESVHQVYQSFDSVVLQQLEATLVRAVKTVLSEKTTGSVVSAK